MSSRKASIKETGEELSPEEWERFERAVQYEKARRHRGTLDGRREIPGADMSLMVGPDAKGPLGRTERAR